MFGFSRVRLWLNRGQREHIFFDFRQAPRIIFMDLQQQLEDLKVSTQAKLKEMKGDHQKELH